MIAIVVWIVAMLAMPANSATTAPADVPAVVAFVSEVVELTIETDSLRVDGHYRLRFGEDAGGGEIGLFYPYPRDEDLGGARTVGLDWRPVGDAPWQPLAIREVGRGAGAHWQVPIVAGGEVEVRTTYRQALRSRYARYIVTTTARWGRPLEHARFVIRLPAGCEPLNFSVPFVRCPDEGPTAWCHEATDFLPDRDVVVRWR